MTREDCGVQGAASVGGLGRGLGILGAFTSARSSQGCGGLSARMAKGRAGGLVALAVAMVAVLTLGMGVSVAEAAPKGVAAFFGNPAGSASSLAGQFGSGSPLGAAVNSNPASPYFGDVYAVDSSNHRVQRFSSLGEFELMWGKDVIKTAPTVNTDLGSVFERCTFGPDCKAGIADSLGGEFVTPTGVAVDQTTGNVYVVERNNTGGGRVQAFTGDGQFLWVVGKDVVQAGGPGDVPTPSIVVNERQSVVIGAFDFFGCGCAVPVTGGDFTLTLDGQTTTPAIPYDATAAQVKAALEALSNVDTVTVTGGPGPSSGWTVEFTGALAGINVSQMTINTGGLVPAGFSSGSVSTTQTGSSTSDGPAEVCTVATTCKIATIGAKGGEFAAGGTDGTSGGGNGIAVSPVVNPLTGAGNVLVTDRGNRRVQEFTSTGGFVRAFGWDTVTNGSPSDPTNVSTFQVCTVAADCKAAASGGADPGRFGNNAPNRVAVDSTGAIYTVENSANFRVQKFTSQVGPPELAASVVNPNVGGSGPALNLSGTASTSSPMDIAVGPANHLFVVKAFAVGVGTPSATVAERRVVELDNAGALVDVHAPRAGIPATTYLAVNADSDEIYMTTPAAPVGGGQGVYVLGQSSVPTVSLGVGSVGVHTAQLNGLVNPGGPDTPIGIRTKYHLEYRKVGAPSWIALSADKDAGNGFANVSVSQALGDLEANTAYEARLVASKPFSGVANVVTAPEAFTTQPSRPDIDSVYVSERESTTVKLNARINPNGAATTYRFEYGTTAAYGTSVPIPDGNAGMGTSTQTFTEAIPGLEPDTTYHYRLTATNPNGTNKSADKTFTTRSAAQAPIGRGYELVSPADKVGGTGLSTWYTGVASHGNVGVPAYEAERYSSLSYYGGSIIDGGFSYGADAALGERTPAGWVNKPAFNRPGGIGTGEFVKLPTLQSMSDDLSLTAWTAQSQLALFPEQRDVWGSLLGNASGQALREWDTGRWEITAPLAPSQQVGLDAATQVAADGGYALVSGLIRGVAGPGDPTNAAFSGGPSDLVCPDSGSCNRSVYVEDVTAGLSDSYPGEGIRSLANACTGEGDARTKIPRVDATGKIVPAECPAALPGRDSRLISPRGASVAAGGTLRGHMSDDGWRVFFMSPDHLNVANNVACTSISPDVEGTKCPPQVYVRQRNQDGSVTTRWISQSAVAGQAASLMAAVVFEGATPDGDKAFFRTASPLTADDLNGDSQQPGGVKTGTPNPDSVDLYMYDFPDAPGADPGDGTLTRISAGPTGSSDANVSTGSLTTNTGALRAFGNDGSRVYFVTAAPLAGVAPASGTITSPGGTVSQLATNLYAYDATLPVDQRWRFVARLPAGSTLGGCATKGSIRDGDGLAAPNGGQAGTITATDGGNCVRATNDGSFVTFFTDGRLTVDDPDNVTGDVYSYDAVTNELVRLSAAQGGAGGSYVCVTNPGPGFGALCNGDSFVASLTKAPLNMVTDAGPGDRTVFFESASRLVPEDVNDVYDVYQWRNGVLSLLSTGAADADHALYRGNDRSGTNVYISSRDRLSWQDHDVVLDVYSARVDGGIAQPEPPPACELIADACQGGGATVVPTPDLKTSSSSGEGNSDAGVRKTLTVAGPSLRARRLAARSGVLRIVVRTNRAGRVVAVAEARIAGRARRVGRKAVRVQQAGKATLGLRLSRSARRRLQSGKALRVTVRVSSPGARGRAMTVRLPGAKP
jgi:hypothetical protein